MNQWEVVGGDLADFGKGNCVRRLRVEGGWLYQVEIVAIERSGALADKTTYSLSAPIFVAEVAS